MWFLWESTDGSYAHAHLSHSRNQCRLMTVLMGKCSGFPQGHQGPEGFNWEDWILLPFSSSSPACDNAVCILIHCRVTHSALQSVSEAAGSWVMEWEVSNSQMGFFPLPIKHSWLLDLSAAASSLACFPHELNTYAWEKHSDWWASLKHKAVENLCF